MSFSNARTAASVAQPNAVLLAGSNHKVLSIWRTDDNGARPHSKLGWKTRDEFALTFHTRRALALRNAKSSAPALAASLARQGKANAGNELKTG